MTMGTSWATGSWATNAWATGSWADYSGTGNKLMVAWQMEFPWLGIEVAGFPTILSRIDVTRTKWKVKEEGWAANQRVLTNKYRYELIALGGKEYDIKRYVESQVSVVKKGTYAIDLRRYTDSQSFIVEFDNTLRL